ncbi:unnamed protein product [Symbiodinium sp. CCMP2592]|nr:unnamed protein product [Symbiodinium sp. CCMP2592]
MSDSFDLWGASLCWGYEDLPAAPRLEKQGAAEEKASSPPAVQRGVRDSLQERPQANILSTQDIDDHEASFDCGAQEAFHVQDSAVSSTVRSATKRTSSEGAISSTSPARASEQSGAVEKAPSPFREACEAQLGLRRHADLCLASQLWCRRRRGWCPDIGLHVPCRSPGGIEPSSTKCRHAAVRNARGGPRTAVRRRTDSRLRGHLGVLRAKSTEEACFQASAVLGNSAVWLSRWAVRAIASKGSAGGHSCPQAAHGSKCFIESFGIAMVNVTSALYALYALNLQAWSYDRGLGRVQEATAEGQLDNDPPSEWLLDDDDSPLPSTDSLEHFMAGSIDSDKIDREQAARDYELYRNDPEEDRDLPEGPVDVSLADPPAELEEHGESEQGEFSPDRTVIHDDDTAAATGGANTAMADADTDSSTTSGFSTDTSEREGSSMSTFLRTNRVTLSAGFMAIFDVTIAKNYVNRHISSSSKRLRTLTVNLDGMTSATYDHMAVWMQTAPYDVLFLQETHRGFGPEASEWKVGGWTIVSSPDNKSRFAGVAIAIRSSLAGQYVTRSREILPGRILHVRLSGINYSIDLLSCYQYVISSRETTAVNASRREHFWTLLGRCLATLPQRNVLVLAGDFNCAVRRETGTAGPAAPAANKYYFDQDDFLNMAKSNSLCFLNTWTHSDLNDMNTFINGSLRSQIDFILTRRNQADNHARQAKPMPSLDFSPWRLGARHLPVQATVALKPGWLTSTPHAKPQVGYDRQSLETSLRSGDDRSLLFLAEVQQKLQDLGQYTADSLNELLLDCCKSNFPLQGIKTNKRPWQQVVRSIAPKMQGGKVRIRSLEGWHQSSLNMTKYFTRWESLAVEGRSLLDPFLKPFILRRWLGIRIVGPLGIQDASGKALARVLKDRLFEQIRAKLELYPQFAYLRNRSTADAIRRVSAHCAAVRHKLTTVRNTVYAKRQGRAKPRFLGGAQLTLDMSTAFDRLPRRYLLESLEWAEADPELISIILDAHCNCRYHILHEGYSSMVYLDNGVRQGCTLAPLLWALFSVFLLSRIEEQLQSQWPRDSMTLYADDTHCFWDLDTHQDLDFFVRSAVTVLSVYRRYGMKINPEKSALILRLGGTHGARWQKRHLLQLDGKRFFRFSHGADTYDVPIVKQFKYLGIIASYGRFENASLRHRIQAASLARQRLAKILHNSRYLSTKQRLSIYTACVRTVLLYGILHMQLTEKDLLLLHRRDIKYVRAVAKSPVHLTHETTEALLQRLQISSIRSCFLKYAVKSMFQHLDPMEVDASLGKRGGPMQEPQMGPKESETRPKYQRPTSKGQGGQGKGMAPSQATGENNEAAPAQLDPLAAAAEALRSPGQSSTGAQQSQGSKQPNRDQNSRRNWRGGGGGGGWGGGGGGGWNQSRRHYSDGNVQALEENVKLLEAAALNKLYALSVSWKEKREKGEVDCPLRQALLLGLLEIWIQRLEAMTATTPEAEELREKVKGLGYATTWDGQPELRWYFMHWSATDSALIKDTTQEPMENSKVIETLQRLQEEVPFDQTHGGAVRRATVTFLLSLGLREEASHRAFGLMKQLCHNMSGKVIGLRLKMAKMERQPLARVIAERFPPPVQNWRARTGPQQETTDQATVAATASTPVPTAEPTL